MRRTRHQLAGGRDFQLIRATVFEALVGAPPVEARDIHNVALYDGPFATIKAAAP